MSDAWYQELKTSYIEEGIEKNKRDNIENLMRNLGLSREQAVAALSPKGDNKDTTLPKINFQK